MANTSHEFVLVPVVGGTAVAFLWWMWRHPEDVLRWNPRSWFMKKDSDSWKQAVEENRAMSLAFLVMAGVGFLVALIAIAIDYWRSIAQRL